MITSFGPGVGSGICSILRTSVPPGARTTIASHLDHRIRHAKTVEVGSMESAPRLDDANRRDRMPFGCLRPTVRTEPRGGKAEQAAISATLDADLAVAQRPPERLIRSVDVWQRSHDGSLP